MFGGGGSWQGEGESLNPLCSIPHYEHLCPIKYVLNENLCNTNANVKKKDVSL